MKRLFVLVFVAACFEHHDPMNTSINNADCYTCHVPEYNATGTETFPLSQPHASSGCSTDCAQCHTTSVWQTGVGGCSHPEDNFPLASQGTQHTNLKCIDCHSSAITNATGATSVSGANTDCIACHPNSNTMANNHIGVLYDNGTLLGQPYAYSSSDHRFCLDCHPKGLALGHGLGNTFVLPHNGATCAQCHDYASGLGHTNGADVLCVTSGCHRSAHHLDTNHHPSCLNSGCHPSGRGG